MRALVDNYITFAWIIENPSERSKKFIFYGLGQEKLYVEHIKSENNNLKIVNNSIENIEAWINSQNYTFLTEVNVGSWSGINTRDMAKKAGCEDLYKFEYIPFTWGAHSTWNYVGKFNLTTSDNPLHKFMQKPTIIEFNPDLNYVGLTAKLYNYLPMLS